MILAKVRFRSLLLVTLAASLTLALPLSAANIEPSSLPTAEARGFLGKWVVTSELGGQEITLSLEFVDVDGKLGATLRSPAQPQPQVITEIEKASRGLELSYVQQLGETEVAMMMEVRLERGTLHGSITEKGGSFTAELHGEKGGRIPGRATLALGDKDVKVTFGSLKVGSPDHQRLAEVGEGEVFEFMGARATKLFTDADLEFGDVVIKAENAAPDYPGVYSLWLKRVGGGWHLVFNGQPDIWGTMYDPEADVAEIELETTQVEEEEERFQVDLEEVDGQGVLRLAWGKERWSTRFALAR